MLTCNPPGRQAKLWEILPNRKPCTSELQNRLQSPPGAVASHGHPRAKNHLSSENKVRPRNSTHPYRFHGGGAATCEEGDCRVTPGPQGAGLLPAHRHHPVPKVHAVGGPAPQSMGVATLPAPASFPVLKPSRSPQTASENSGPRQISLIS